MTFKVLLFCFFSISFVFCFNFDTDFPIVYTDPSSFSRKPSDRSSYFGYSVILHHDPLQEQAWIQIGAPRANSSTIKNKEPGTVFRCSTFGPCNSVDVDLTTYYDPQRHSRGKKDNAWIGGAMDIDERSGRVVVCGHRWLNNKNNQDYWMEGACYWSHTNESTFEKLLPLEEHDKGIIKDKNNFYTYAYYYGQGQAGFSAHMSNSKKNPEMLLGAPGVYNWDGTTLIYRDSSDFTPIASRLTSRTRHRPVKRAATFTEFADLNIANAIVTTQTEFFGLFGYSLTSGYFFKKKELLYVSGGPRSKTCIGQILLFKFEKHSDQALDVKELRQGYQIGEYFGAALAAGDINQDGLDDLVVGAPFYTNDKYNEGRIFVFLGSKKGSLETPQNSFIEGKEIGGQFGACVMFLGDMHMDGYADIAVGAPYENDGSGAVYIYRGNALGVDSKPCQRIGGEYFLPNVFRGFGISMSKPTDIDNNFYNDLAIGAYASGHTVLLRSKPVVTLQHSIVSLTSRLEPNAEMFEVRACFWYTGSNVPASINVMRRIIVDDLEQRAHLPKTIPSADNITLDEDKINCLNVNVSIKKDITSRNQYDPIKVSISQELVAEQIKREIIHVSPNTHGNQKDKFCKTCPVLNTYRSMKEQTIELPFTLGCAKDNECVTNLELELKFLNIGTEDKYVMGSTDYLSLETTIINHGEKAYLTQLKVELPKSVYFRSTPTNCFEGDMTSVLTCNFENPLYENKQKTITWDLDMKEVNSEKYGDTLHFTLTVLTSSKNTNTNKFTKTLKIVREADIALTGKTSEQSYSYGNITYGKPNFTQIYQVEKFGVSPIDEVFLTIKIPTHIYGSNEVINFLQLYVPEGYHAGQPITCQSNIKYILEKQQDILAQYGSKGLKDMTEETDTLPNDVTTTESTPVKRSVREIKMKLNKEEDNSVTNVTKSEFEHLSNRTFHISCSNSNVICSYVNCSLRSFKTKQNIAMLQIKMLFDVSSLSDLLGNKDIIILSTDGTVTIRTPSNFMQSGYKPDTARVSSVFIGEIPEAKLETWIIIVAVIAGLLLVLLLTLGLIKAGFFRRTKKMELEALKEAEEAEQFKRKSVNCEEVKEDVKEDGSNDEYSIYEKKQ